MTKEEFIKLQSGHVKSGMTLKLYLQQTGTDYSTYNYWRKKYCASGDRSHEIAPSVSLTPAYPAVRSRLTAVRTPMQS